MSDERGAREALQQISTVCTDNIDAAKSDYRMALHFVRQIAVSALTARPSDAAVAVQDTWFTDSTLPIMGMSGDIESDRVLRLLFRRAVTDSDRKRLTEVLNAGEAALALPPDEPARVNELRSQLVKANTALALALPHLDNSDSPGGCDGKHPECGHCSAIAHVRAALTDEQG